MTATEQCPRFYRTARRVYGAHEDAEGVRDFYFIAPAGLEARKADTQRVSPYYADHIRALGALIEKTHDYAGS